MAKQFEATINGVPHSASSYREIRNPADTTEIVGMAPECTVDDLDIAVRAAGNAFKEWSYSSEEERVEACNKIAAAISEHADELARLVTLENGKPLKGAGSEFEAGGASAWAEATGALSLPVKSLPGRDGATVEMHQVPLGVCGSITPWNFPLMIAVWHMLPAIRTGNTIVIKPSEYTPLSTLRLVELMNEHLPPGVVNSIAAEKDVGPAMATHEDIAKIVFTGSTGTGVKIRQACAPTMKRLTLELGGNDPGILLPGVDVGKIAEDVFWSAFVNTGQTCGALKRLYVHESQYDEVAETLSEIVGSMPMGNGLDENIFLGPLTNAIQKKIVSSLVDDARNEGCRVVSGEAPVTDTGYFYPASLVLGAKDGMRVVDEEQFGPVLPIIKYSNVDDAVDSANALDYGLTASVWSLDAAEAAEVAKRVEAGTVTINQHANISPMVPFGGIKKSGLGVEFGVEGLKAFTNIKIYNQAP